MNDQASLRNKGKIDKTDQQGMRERQIRRRVVFGLGIVVPLGLAAKFYAGPGHGWFNDYGAGVLYEVFWILAAFFVWPGRGWTARIPVCVFVGTSLLEVLQLWHPWFLERIRDTFPGRALIGTTFVWWDFPHYVLGCAIGWLWLRRLERFQ